MKIFNLIALSLLITACATYPTQKEMETEVKNYQLPGKPNKGEGIVYVGRPESMGGLVKFNVWLEKECKKTEMGWTRGSQHIYFYLPAGPHKLLSVAENTDDILIEVREGQPLFVEQEPHMGFLYARNSLHLRDDLKGRYMMKK